MLRAGVGPMVGMALMLSLVACADSSLPGGTGDQADTNNAGNNAGNNDVNNEPGDPNNDVNNDPNNDVNNDPNNVANNDPNNDDGTPDAGDGPQDAGDQEVGPEVDADLPDGGDACTVINLQAENALLPVDIIWVIDASPSMIEEITAIEANLNTFAQRVGASELDYRVVVIGSEDEHCFDARCYKEICVPPPLSAEATCPDVDGPRYLHVRRAVHSSDGIDIAIEEFPSYRPFLRPGALTHYVMVTDDDAGFGPDDEDFLAFVQANSATFGAGLTFHSVVDLVGYVPGCGVFDEECSCGEERGQAYINISEATGGLVQSVCQEDWGPIFDALLQRVQEGTALPCAFRLPELEPGQRINPNQVNVVFMSEDRSQREIIPQVTDEGDCALADGWYYDDPVNPTTLTLCPQVCSRPTDIIEIEVGCRTVKH